MNAVLRGGPFDGQVVEAYNHGTQWHGRHEGVNVFYLCQWKAPLHIRGMRVLDYWFTADR